MKCLAVSAAILLALVAPAVSAQAFPLSRNTAAMGAQVNSQVGATNQGRNAARIQQSSGSVSAPGYLAHGLPGSVFPETSGGAPLLAQIFGPGPLVNNNIAIGTQVNAKTGDGNQGGNQMMVGQTAAGAAGPFGGLVNQNLALGTQMNLQTGGANLGGNDLGALQQIYGGFPAK
jgi:hypothetical protein